MTAATRQWDSLDLAQAQQFAMQLQHIEQGLATLGLFETRNAVNEATQKMGWEMERRIRKGYTKKGAARGT